MGVEKYLTSFTLNVSSMVYNVNDFCIIGNLSRKDVQICRHVLLFYLLLHNRADQL